MAQNKALKNTIQKKYDPLEIESKWQRIWEENQIYQPNLDSAKKPFYNLMMFPYPSAEGMHVGNMYAFTGSDIYGRYKKMQGFDVFEPIGLDGFGIHSENFAIKIGRHPMEQAKISEENFYKQLHVTGNAYDWSNTVETYKPDYYRWTQWIFTELFKAGLAYRQNAQVNWCPSCMTVLADEQVIDGKCERCGSAVEKKQLKQWFFRITSYADKLLTNIPFLDWPHKVKIAQTSWIGKSMGAKIMFKIDDSDKKIEVFTTRPDTLYGATFLVVAPEHPFVSSVVNGEVRDYIQMAKKKTERQRIEEGKEKTGVFSGLYALHPLTEAKLPIWIADYVMMGYGSGAIMAVPAHDQRDYEFAKKLDLPIIEVISSKEGIHKKAYTGFGTVINSQQWNGLKMPSELDKVVESLEQKRVAVKQVQYHLRDWLISRQRYWGAPIPMIFCKHCAREGKSWFTIQGKDNPNDWDATGWYPEENLPLELPYIKDYKPIGKGQSPLSYDPNFYAVKCPGCGKEARRETDVSDTFLDSSWYFLRYVSNDKDNEAFDKKRIEKWLPVNMYIGGAEHSVLHLLYSRFMAMAFHDLGYYHHFEEPFSRFYAHGLLIKEGSKMSKSKGNVVVPDTYIKKYGADTLRTYLMFLGPFNQGGDFYDSGIEGIYRFLKRVWALFTNQVITGKQMDASAKIFINKAVKTLTEDLEALRFNTAIAQLMILYNFLSDQKELSVDAVSIFLRLLAPFAPHLTEELWQEIISPSFKGRVSASSVFGSIHKEKWPTYQDSLLEEKEAIVVVQVNGKIRDTIQVQRADISRQEIVENLAKQRSKIQKYIKGAKIKKVIYREGKILNFVV